MIWIVTPFRPEVGYQNFGVIFCLYLQGIIRHVSTKFTKCFWEPECHHFNTQRYDPHPRVLRELEMGEPRSLSRRFGEEQIRLSIPWIEPRTVQLVP